MKVHELIEMLEGLSPDAEVLIMSQENWPFENAVRGVRGVITRAGMVAADEFGDDGEEPEYGEGCAPDDVFLVEGRQLRYGCKAAWEACG